ncbi:MAG: hypothetical protein AAGF45_05115 [Pseudomonadota bacterium]
MDSIAIRSGGALTAVDLKPGDVDEIYELYLSALSAVPNPAAVRTDEPSFFQEMFDVGGEILGLRGSDERLLAYGVIRPELASEQDRFGLSGLVPEHAGLWVLDGSAVRPNHRQLGLQRAMIERRLLRLRSRGIGFAIAKASPGNLPSKRNLLKRGFALVAKIKKSYGWRYVHARRTATPVVADGEGEWIASGDLSAVDLRFGRGEAAFACRVGGDGLPLLKFCPWSGSL